MVTPVRYTSQKQQELRSRHQLSDRFVDFGWVPTVPEDLGEDFTVHIYFEGRATGVNFYVQEKSVTNLVERRKGDHLSYPFEVKDLTHWETFTLPVVLVIWDVYLQEGRWAFLPTVIKELDQKHPNWRNQKTKTIHIPWRHTTDDVGLTRLRHTIGRYLYPQIASKTPLEVKIEFSFPKTEAGKLEFEAFERAVKRGDKGSWEGKVESVSPSWRPWLGDLVQSQVIVSTGSVLHPKVYAATIDMISNNGETASVNIELKAVKVGTEVIEMSNYHQPASFFHFRLIIPRKFEQFSASLVLNTKLNTKTPNIGNDANEASNNLKFLRGLIAGGKLRLTLPSFDNINLTTSIPAQKNRDLLPPEQLTQLIDKLCMIQSRFGIFIAVPVEGFLEKDVSAIHELAAIIERGHISKNGKGFMTAEFKKDALEVILDVYRQGKPHHFTLVYDKAKVELFDTPIPVGRMTRHVTGELDIKLEELETAVRKLKPDEALRIKVINGELIEIFPDWYEREAKRLGKLLVDKFNAKAVYLFGSLAWSDNFHPQTDIDLAVTGLPSENFFEAIGFIERHSQFPVDLVDLNDVSEALRDKILEKGRLLSAREPVAEFS